MSQSEEWVLTVYDFGYGEGYMLTKGTSLSAFSYFSTLRFGLSQVHQSVFRDRSYHHKTR